MNRFLRNLSTWSVAISFVLSATPVFAEDNFLWTRTDGSVFRWDIKEDFFTNREGLGREKSFRINGIEYYKNREVHQSWRWQILNGDKIVNTDRCVHFHLGDRLTGDSYSSEFICQIYFHKIEAGMKDLKLNLSYRTTIDESGPSIFEKSIPFSIRDFQKLLSEKVEQEVDGYEDSGILVTHDGRLKYRQKLSMSYNTEPLRNENGAVKLCISEKCFFGKPLGEMTYIFDIKLSKTQIDFLQKTNRVSVSASYENMTSGPDELSVKFLNPPSPTTKMSASFSVPVSWKLGVLFPVRIKVSGSGSARCSLSTGPSYNGSTFPVTWGSGTFAALGNKTTTVKALMATNHKGTYGIALSCKDVSNGAQLRIPRWWNYLIQN